MTQKLVIAPSGTVVNNIPKFSTTTGQVADTGLDANSVGAASASQTQMETGTATNVFSSPGRQQFHPGHPKAWYRYNQATPAVLSSHNVSSITDTSTGIFTVNLSITFSSSVESFTGASVQLGYVDPIATAFAATSATMRTTDLAGTLTDTHNCGAFLGDL